MADSSRRCDENNTTPAGGERYFAAHTLEETKAALTDIPPVDDDLPRWTVMFRGGTVFRVAGGPSGGDAEFKGYGANHDLPVHHFTDEEIAEQARASNQKVWAAQQAFPGEVGRAVRQAYQRLTAAGYPYPGSYAADRCVELLKDERRYGAQEPWLVQWPSLDGEPAAWGNRALNIVIVGGGMTAACRRGGELRRYDYLFPEVAAVLAPQGELWEYDTEGRFARGVFAAAKGPARPHSAA